MKINKIKKNLRKQFELYLIKFKVYERFTKKERQNKLLNNGLEKTIISFKKALSIIFKYHKLKKKILFVGAPKIIEKAVNEETIHLSLPSNFNFRTIIFNKPLYNGLKLKSQLKKKNRYVLSKISKRPHLIVIFQTEQNELLLNEGFSYKIPIIQFGYNKKEHYCKQTYGIPGNLNSIYNRTIESNIFFIALNSLLNKK